MGIVREEYHKGGPIMWSLWNHSFAIVCILISNFIIKSVPPTSEPTSQAFQMATRTYPNPVFFLGGGAIHHHESGLKNDGFEQIHLFLLTNSKPQIFRGISLADHLWLFETHSISPIFSRDFFNANFTNGIQPPHGSARTPIRSCKKIHVVPRRAGSESYVSWPARKLNFFCWWIFRTWDSLPEQWMFNSNWL